MATVNIFDIQNVVRSVKAMIVSGFVYLVYWVLNMVIPTGQSGKMVVLLLWFIMSLPLTGYLYNKWWGWD